MRYHLSDVVREPSCAPGWWEDLPMRRRAWWAEVLLQPGAGWLRWGGEYVPWWEYLDGYAYDGGGAVCYPPARRVWQYVVGHLAVPWRMARHHLAWEEATFSWSDLPTDPDRKTLYR